MVADQKRWFKLWCTAPGDDHLQRLSVADRWAWAVLGTYTKAHGTRGSVVVSDSNAALAAEMGVPVAELVATVRRLPHVQVSANGHKTANGEITVTWENWQKYQEDSTVAERVTRLRSKRRGEERRREEKRTTPPEVPPAKVDVFGSEAPASSFKIDPAILEALNRLRLFRAVPRFRDPDWWQSMILAFPRIDHLEALSEAHGYLLSSKKRYTDLPAFVRNSFKRAQEEADR